MNNNMKFKGKNQNQQNSMKKRVNFNNTSQQWRLNKSNSKPIPPNRKVINQNLSQIKQGLTPLKKAQEAYYGNNSRSPLLKNSDGTTSSKLPVHARLGNKGLKRLQNNVNKSIPKVSVSQLLAQKRALKLKAIEQQNRIRQLGVAMRNGNFIANKTGMRSDFILKSQQIQNKKMNNANIIRKNMKQSKFQPKPISDYRISVALPRNLQNSQTSSNRPPVRSLEVNPQIQREIALIQQRYHQSQTATGVLPPAIPGLTVDIHQGLNMHHTLGKSLVTTHPISVTGINRETTTTIIPQRKKISLNERFGLL